MVGSRESGCDQMDETEAHVLQLCEEALRGLKKAKEMGLDALCVTDEWRECRGLAAQTYKTFVAYGRPNKLSHVFLDQAERQVRQALREGGKGRLLHDIQRVLGLTLAAKGALGFINEEDQQLQHRPFQVCEDAKHHKKQEAFREIQDRRKRQQEVKHCFDASLKCFAEAELSAPNITARAIVVAERSEALILQARRHLLMGGRVDHTLTLLGQAVNSFRAALQLGKDSPSLNATAAVNQGWGKMKQQPTSREKIENWGDSKDYGEGKSGRRETWTDEEACCGAILPLERELNASRVLTSIRKAIQLMELIRP